jgi:hypothetical protein
VDIDDLLSDDTLFGRIVSSKISISNVSEELQLFQEGLPIAALQNHRDLEVRLFGAEFRYITEKRNQNDANPLIHSRN